MDKIDNVLETVFSHKYGSIVLTMFLVFYSGLAAPKLPSFIRNLFENPIFRILILSLIVYKGNKDPQLAIMIAVGFTVTMNFISSQRFFENFSNHSGSPHSGDDQTNSTSSPDDDTTNSEADMTEDNMSEGNMNQGTNNQGTNNQGTNNQGTNNQGTNNQGTNDDPFENTTDDQADYMDN